MEMPVVFTLTDFFNDIHANKEYIHRTIHTSCLCKYACKTFVLWDCVLSFLKINPLLTASQSWQSTEAHILTAVYLVHYVYVPNHAALRVNTLTFCRSQCSMLDLKIGMNAER